MLGSALAVKPLLTVTDGEIRPYERVRTESKALARLEELSLDALARAASVMVLWMLPSIISTTQTAHVGSSSGSKAGCDAEMS